MIKNNALEGDDVKKAVRLADKLKTDFDKAAKSKKEKLSEQISITRDKNLKQKEQAEQALNDIKRQEREKIKYFNSKAKDRDSAVREMKEAIQEDLE